MQTGDTRKEPHRHMDTTELLLNTRDAALRLGLPTRTLEDMRHDGIGPAYVRVARRLVRYRVTDLDAYVADLPTVHPEAHAAG